MLFTLTRHPEDDIENTKQIFISLLRAAMKTDLLEKTTIYHIIKNLLTEKVQAVCENSNPQSCCIDLAINSLGQYSKISL